MAVVTTEFISSSERERRVVGVLNDLYLQGARNGWGDIHFESEEDGSMLVRVRQDGMMLERARFAEHEVSVVVNKFRYRANLDVSDTRHEQDGRFVQICDDRRIDVRLSIIPTIFGYSIVTRLLDSKKAGMPIEQLGMSEETEKAFRYALSQNEGLILTGGPTGSGKTTTLYAALNVLNTNYRKIVTAEDPVEYILKGVQQCPVGSGTGRSFASALRAMMRQNPNVILIGEIRDEETAQMAMRASLTGHLVLATIHANTPLDTIHRLEDLGVSPQLLVSSVRIILAQRILQLVCTECAQRAPLVDPSLFTRYGLEPPKFEMVGSGCSSCFNTGYRYRRAIYEAAVMNKDLRSGIKDGLGREALMGTLKKQPQHEPLIVAGLRLVIDGKTNTSELLRALSDDAF
jgi:type II secretory ATPase GspE/PulE/Tfp pilus assembly ATPase PilB-like protein